MKPRVLCPARVLVVPLSFVLACAAGALAAQEAGGEKAPEKATPKGPTLPVFADGQAQVVEGFADPSEWIRQELWVETSFDSDDDGRPDRMHVDVVRQKQTDTEGLKVPVVYETSPYFAGTGGTAKQYFWDPKQEVGATPPTRTNLPPIRYRDRRPVISNSEVGKWVPRGFAVVHSESPGTGLSQGCPTVGGDNESLAPKAVIDWLNGRAKGYTTVDGDERVEATWSTGKVGMIGTSYNGTLPIAAATTGVEGLEAIIPIAPNTSYYHYYRSHGLIRHPGGYMGEDIDVLYDFINSGNPDKREHCNKKVRDGEMAQGQDRVSGDYNDFWAGRDYMNDLGPMKAATLMAHGFNDWNVMPEHSVRIYTTLKQKGLPVQAYFHQHGHGGPPPMVLMNRWFTRFLYGVENGVEKDPRAWIVREDENSGGDDAEQEAAGGRRRRREMQDPTPYPDYPHPDASPVVLHLRTGGVDIGGLETSAQAGQGHEQLIDDVSIEGAKLAQAETSEHRLLYATGELTAPLHLSGTPRLTIRMACSKASANLSVWLVALPWTNSRTLTDDIITRGWADLQNHASLTHGEPLEPGKFYAMTFDLQPDDQIVQPGQRIGLMVFSSDRDFTLWPPPGTELTLDLDATTLALPVVGGSAGYERAFAPRKISPAEPDADRSGSDKGPAKTTPDKK